MPSINALSQGIPVWCPSLTDLDLPLATLINMTRKRKHCSPAHKRQQEQRLSDYAQQDISTVIRRSALDKQRLKAKLKGLISLLAPIKYY
jgi:hypothetical protein